MRKVSGRRLQEETFQSKVKCTAQVIACSRVYAWVSGCVCICMRSLYASHFGRRRSVVSTLQQMQHPPLREPSWLQSLSLISAHTVAIHLINICAFIEHLLGIWHCDIYWGYISEQEWHSPHPQGAHSLRGRQMNEKLKFSGVSPQIGEVKERARRRKLNMQGRREESGNVFWKTWSLAEIWRMSWIGQGKGKVSVWGRGHSMGKGSGGRILPCTWWKSAVWAKASSVLGRVSGVLEPSMGQAWQ